MGKKLTVQELLPSGFINGLFPSSTAEVFRERLLKQLKQQFEGLDLEAVRYPALLPSGSSRL